ncbi:hypothetical protein NLJ89_g8403 [Agrocybe chaxingu]|uniref:Uncharacterized protein n=1 Tax=Agrocybe chaxingu TaxID=84603 RepID=A0A9W8JVB7_9AGAR|nr:hypothetical protein NLJ89_g8403 [Agrocybe chaxingu]
MAVIWGFDLSEMSWSAFEHRRMFEKRWYLRRERFIIYQLAMLIALAAECTATYALAKYEFLQSNIGRLSGHTASLHSNDIRAAAILTIVFCVFVATLFGADFFFLLFWPKRRYPRWYDMTKKAIAVWICLGVGAAAIMSTIVVAMNEAYISGVGDRTAIELVDSYPRPPLVYRTFPQNIAWVVLLWLALIPTISSTMLMFKSSVHDSRYGTMPKNIIDLNDAGDVGPPRHEE